MRRRAGQDTRRLLAQSRHYKVLQLEGGWAATDVMQRADMRSKRRAVSIAGSVNLALLTLTLACVSSLAHAQSADLVLCASAASRRALYQLGRAYAANQQLPEAVAAYRKAADKGSTSA